MSLCLAIKLWRRLGVDIIHKFQRSIITLIWNNDWSSTCTRYKWHLGSFWKPPESRERRRWRDTLARRGQCRARWPEARFPERRDEEAIPTEQFDREMPSDVRIRWKAERCQRRLHLQGHRRHLRLLRRRPLDRLLLRSGRITLFKKIWKSWNIPDPSPFYRCNYK